MTVIKLVAALIIVERLSEVAVYSHVIITARGCESKQSSKMWSARCADS